MKQQIVRTTIFGVSLTLKVDADEEHVHRVIEFLEKKGRDIMVNMIEPDPHRISVIVNILLADELLSGGSNEDTPKVDQIAQDLIQLINEKIDD